MDVNALILDAKKTTDAMDAQASAMFGSLKSDMINSSNALKAFATNIINNVNTVTTDDLAQLNEQIRLAKLQLMQLQAQQSGINFALYAAGAAVILGLVIYFTSPSFKKLLS